jgi:hypothetical protein
MIIVVSMMATAAIAPMTMPAMAPADKPGFGEGPGGKMVGVAVADELGVDAIEPGVMDGVTEDEVDVVVVPT